MTSQNSVYELIKSLCECLANDHSSNVAAEAAAHISDQQLETKAILKKCKSRAYEVLLHQLPWKNLDPALNDIYFQQFVMRITCNNKIDHRHCDDFDQCLDSLCRDGVLDDDCGQSIISFLVHLRNTGDQVHTHLN